MICERYGGFRSSSLAEVGLELLLARVGELHHAVADDAGDDAANRREDEEEGLGIAGLPHQPPPRLALLPQQRHPSLPPRSRPPQPQQSSNSLNLRSLRPTNYTTPSFLQKNFKHYIIYNSVFINIQDPRFSKLRK